MLIYYKLQLINKSLFAYLFCDMIEVIKHLSAS